MKHISIDKFDIYALNKAKLGDELSEFENHINECKECKQYLDEIIEFYKEYDKTSDINVTKKDIESILLKRQTQYKSNLDQIFKIPEPSFLKKIISSFNSIIEKIEQNFFTLSMPLRWSLATVTVAVFIFFIYIIIKPQHQELISKKEIPITDTTKKEQKIDTSKIQEEKKQVEKKEEAPQPELASISPISIEGNKGADNYKYLRCTNRNTKSATLLIFNSKIRLDTIKGNKNLEIFANSHQESYRIQFPKTKLASQIGSGINHVCKMDEGKFGYIKISVGENKV